MYLKEKKEHHISEYDSHKILVELKKIHSPMTIRYCTIDLPDEWLVDVIDYRTTSGVITLDRMITRKSMDDHIKTYEKDGFVRKTLS